MSATFIYLSVILIQICLKDNESEKESQLNEQLLARNVDSDSYYYTEEYTNSQYLRDDDQNSIVDQKHFRYDQSLRDTASREVSENASDYNSQDIAAHFRSNYAVNAQDFHRSPKKLKPSGSQARLHPQQVQA